MGQGRPMDTFTDEGQKGIATWNVATQRNEAGSITVAGLLSQQAAIPRGRNVIYIAPFLSFLSL